MANKTHNQYSSFHAGQFLKESLQRSGFNIEGLAKKACMDVQDLEELFGQSNMDAGLFVGIGMHMGTAFFDPLHEAFFRNYYL